MHNVESKRFPKLFLVIFVGISSIGSSSSFSSSSSDSSDDSKLSQFDRVCSKVSFSFNLKVCHRKKWYQLYMSVFHKLLLRASRISPYFWKPKEKPNWTKYSKRPKIWHSYGILQKLLSEFSTGNILLKNYVAIYFCH